MSASIGSLLTEPPIAAEEPVARSLDAAPPVLVSLPTMNFLAGVDEAGLGPILGPLVVGGVAMAGPEGKDPWQVLRRHVARKKHEKGKVRVADSKKVNQGPHGFRHLEETALVFWTAQHGEPPRDLASWLEALGHDLEPLRRCPWYGALDLTLPQEADLGWIRLTGELVGRSLQKAEITLLDLAVRAVDVEEWNLLIRDTDNKSRAHFHAYSEVLVRLLSQLGAAAAGVDGGRVHLVADRCGGRMHYAHDLRKLDPTAAVDVLDEQPACSRYRLRRPDAEMLVTFAERAEDRAFPTALASCLAKYARELMVRCLNRWFCARVPGLAPTAGYYVDGHRFLADVEHELAAGDLPRHRLVRVR
jgi:ribonuclease HII